MCFLNIAPSCAILNNPNGNIQFTSGGDAVLQIPQGISVDNRVFKLVIEIIYHIDADNDINSFLRIGSTDVGNLSLNPGLHVPSDCGFHIEVDLFWSSNLQVLHLFQTPISITWPVGQDVSGVSGTIFIINQSDIQFKINCTSGNGNPNNSSVTLTKFGFEL